ncbi:MAG: hypothetical protein AB8B91_15355 [Rubripirellula sp.]
MIRNALTVVFIALLLLLSSPLHAAKPPLRSSNDRFGDLIDRLIQGNRFDQAIELCDLKQAEFQPNSDELAIWVIRRSQVLAKRQMSLTSFLASEVEQIQKPINEWLAAYPEHPRRSFLAAQNIAVQRDAARHSVLRAAVSPSDDSAKDSATEQLLRATTVTLALATEVSDRRAVLDSNRQTGGGRPRASDFALADDLLRLQHELQVEAVSLALMQTELFDRGSTDFIAAATRAEQAAVNALTKVPNDTPARREVERLKVEAIFRSGQLGRAEAELAVLVRSFLPNVPARLRALIVRMSLASKKEKAADALLSDFYGVDPLAAPPSIEMDLAKLDSLIQSDRGQEVGNWLEVIEKRGGAYARRRAEAISLAKLRGATTGRTPIINAAIVAAQGQDWLRRGEPGRAGELLAAAAAAESDADRAIKRAIEAAAAFQSAGRLLEASDVLAEVPLQKPNGANAANAHLQSAVLIQASKLPDRGAKIETRLRNHLRQWPAGESARASRKWLIKLLTSSDRWIDAAEVATSVAPAEATKAEITAAIDLWQMAIRKTDEEHFSSALNQFRSSFERLQESDSFRLQYVRAAALILDRDSISVLSIDTVATDEREGFIDAVLEFRRSGQVSDALKSPPDGLLEQAVWRLMRDGRSYAQRRAPIAEMIGRWLDADDPSLEQAERLLWLGDIEKATNMLAQVSKQSATAMKRAAKLLGSSGQAKAQSVGVQYWDRLAAGSKQGTPLWHEAKIAGIQLLTKAGKQEEAIRRAKYIQLTMPSMEQHWQSQYKSLIQQK